VRAIWRAVLLRAIGEEVSSWTYRPFLATADEDATVNESLVPSGAGTGMVAPV